MRTALTIAVATIWLTGCAPAVQPDAQETDLTIRVMTFNIEWGGKNVSFDNVVEAIRRSGADVVGIQEAEGNLDELATALGWHADLRNYAISRFPLLDPGGANGRYVFVEAAKGRVFALANLHLPSDPYGPDLVRDGATINAVMQNEREARLPALEPFLQALPPLVDAGIPVIVTGDFNSPSHLDWVPATVRLRAFLDYPAPWPVTVAMEDAGFEDTWRTLFRDPVVSQGLTWWAARPPLAAYAPGENDPQDRIDYIWFAGPAAPLSAALVGEPDGPEVSVGIAPWPSDHRGVVATFRIEPASMPGIVTTDRRVYRSGQTVRITAQAAPAVEPRVTIRDRQSGTAVESVTANGGTVEWLPPGTGHYEAFVDDRPELGAREFWVLPETAAPVVQIVAGDGTDALDITWRNGPGHRNDYLALYAESDAAKTEAMLAWSYVDARPHGRMPLTRLGPTGGGVTDQDWTVAPGRYLVRLMKDDGYEPLAETRRFEIR